MLRRWAISAAHATEEVASESRTAPLAAARLLSRRWIGIVEVPAHVEQALDTATQSVVGGDGQHLTAASRRLVSLLRNNSRTSRRGGGHARVEMDAASGMRKREKKKGSRSHTQMLRELQFSQGALISDDVWDSKPKKDDTDLFAETERAAASEAESKEAGNKAPAYSTAETAAYAASRLPATYAVLYKVMSELQARLQDFKPRKMLDFGSGPGTAIWAASAVWGGATLKAVHAVEKSLEMMAVGHQCQTALRAASAPVPPVQWSRKLSRSASGHDLVVASYVLAELRTPAERRSIVEALWARTTGVLLLVEPGTPVGSANIREARTQILAKERISSTIAHAAEAVAEREEGMTAASGGGAAATGGAARQTGVHVVAPCPHEGGCPMDGTDSWCHFAQRFRRTTSQKRIKVLAGGQKPRDYQDERFSYVALQRRPRPVRIRTRIAKAALDTASEELAAINPVRSADGAAMGSEMAVSEEDEDEDEDEILEPPSEEALALIMDSIRDDDSSGDEDSDEDTVDQAAFLKEVAQYSNMHKAATNLPESTPNVAVDVQTATTTVEADIVTHTADFVTFVTDAKSHAGGHSIEVQEADEEENDDTEATILDPRDVDAAVAASNSWSRVIRPPRKKRGHVVLDLCCSSGPADRGPPQLQKQFLSKGSLKDAALYRMVRKLRWGDLWPLERS